MAFNWGQGLGGAGTGAAAGASVGGPWGAAAGGLAGLLGGFLGNPADKGMKDLNQIPDVLHKNLDPYADAGKGALSDWQKMIQEQMQNPGDILKRLGSGYTESPGYQFELKQGQNEINNAAAAGGMAGAPAHQQVAGEMATNLANKDFNQYLNNALGIYGTGVSGTQDLTKLGQGSSTELATSLANLLQNKAGLKYAGEANQNNMQGGFINSILQLLGQHNK